MNYKITISDEVKKKLIGAFWTGVAIGLQHIVSESIKSSGKGVGNKAKSMFNLSENKSKKETEDEFEFFNTNMLQNVNVETRLHYIRSSIQNMLYNYSINKKLDNISLKKSIIFAKQIYKVKDCETVELLNDYMDICNMIKNNNVEYLNRFKEKYDVRERMELSKAVN